MCFNMENAEDLLSKLDAALTEVEQGRTSQNVENVKRFAHESANGPSTKLSSEPINKKQKMAA